VIRVFVSSVSKGLESTRSQVVSDLQKAGYAVNAMEQFGAQAQPPIDVCLREIRKAEAVVLLVGPRYGSLLPQGVSYTHAEFREARSRGIPILAFAIPTDPDLTTEERDQLEAFLTEVGSVATYDKLASGESLDRVSAKVLAALSSAKDRGDLRSRYSIFQPYDQFFAPQLQSGGALFNHRGPFLGRETQMKSIVDFISGPEALFLLKAPGGAGKSRLLLEAARTLSTGSSARKVLFVDAGAQWSAEDITRLPSAPTVLVFDDAHRRPDLDRLIFACQQQIEDLKCVIAVRPSAIGIVLPLVSQFVTDGARPEIDLAPLSKLDADTLAKHYLGSTLEHLADRLVALADRNPLVIRIGAQCIANHLVPPELLERTPEAFRRAVLDRLLDDPTLTQGDAKGYRAILEIVSAIGPVIVEGDEFVAKIGARFGASNHQVRRLVADLERSGFLARRGRLVRVSPDVLADHLLYRAAVDENGAPTGFVDEMIRAFAPDLLENILANAAELDWRAAAASTHESVLATTWRDILATLPGATVLQRSALLKQLRRPALFAPEQVLRIAEWLTDHPEAPEDEQLARWGLKHGPDMLLDELSSTFGFIATHPDFTKRCAKRLWELAAQDERATNPNPSHPRRQLEDLLDYDQRSDWESPDGVHARIVQVFVERLQEARQQEVPWAVSALASALDRIGEANSSNRRVFTIRQFSLAEYLPVLNDRRRTVMTCLRDVALSDRPAEAIAALTGLGRLLDAPRGPLGRGLEPSEQALWKPEATFAIELLMDIANRAPHEVIRYAARRQLREVVSEYWPDIAQEVEGAVRNCPSVPAEGLYDVLVGPPRPERLDDHRAEDERRAELAREAAKEFWHQHQNAPAVIRSMLEAITALRPLKTHLDSNAATLMREIVAQETSQAEAVARALADSGEPGARLLRPALFGINEHNPHLAEQLAEEFTGSSNELTRAAAVDAMQWMVESTTDPSRLLALMSRLSGDSSGVVRQAVAHALRRFRTQVPSEALRVLTSIQWEGDLSVATAVMEGLDSRYGLDPEALTDADVDALLARIERLRSLDSHAYDVLEFIEFASKRRPQQTLEMLLRRIQSVDDHPRQPDTDPFVPVPYNGRGLSLPGVHDSPGYLDRLRLVRDATVGARQMATFWMPVLFHVASNGLESAIPVLREWIASGDASKLVAAAHLLRAFDHSVVFTNHEFIAEVLDAAAGCGSECLQDVKSELFGVAIGGVYSSPPGEPAPRHVSDKAEAQKLAGVYANRAPAREFFEALTAHAENSIKRTIQDWEEGGEDE